MNLKYENLFSIVKNILCGIILGFSIIIPGLSGSILAMIMKLYDKIMYSLSHLTKEFKASILFLLPLLFGGIIGLLLGAMLIKVLFNMFPFFLICFFSGLMIGSYQLLIKQIKEFKKSIINNSLFICGFLITIIFYVITIFNKEELFVEYKFHDYLIFVLIGVALAITQLVPGLSATVLLMIIGYYNYFLSILNLNTIFDTKLVLVLIMIFIGLVLGIIIFSKFINYLLLNKRDKFMYLISGLSIGSLLCVFFDENCLSIYQQWNSNNVIYYILVGLILLVFGMLISSILIEIFDKRSNIYEK